MANIGDRFKTGETCRAGGIYGFDGYVDGRAGQQPTQEERVIPLDSGKTFPPIRSTDRAAYWKLQRLQ